MLQQDPDAVGRAGGGRQDEGRVSVSRPLLQAQLRRGHRCHAEEPWSNPWESPANREFGTSRFHLLTLQDRHEDVGVLLPGGGGCVQRQSALGVALGKGRCAVGQRLQCARVTLWKVGAVPEKGFLFRTSDQPLLDLNFLCRVFVALPLRMAAMIFRKASLFGSSLMCQKN